MTDPDERRVRTALEGLRFPAAHHELVAFAMDRGGVEPEVLAALEALPSRAFTSSDDVVISLPDQHHRPAGPGLAVSPGGADVRSA